LLGFEIMAARLKIITPKRSGARENLAATIIERDAVERICHKARDAAERANGLIAKAEERLREAQTSVEKAREAQARAAIKAAKAGKPPPAAAETRESRAREVDAQDALEAARAALEACEQTLAEHEADLQRANRDVGKAADDVIRSEVGARLLQETAMLQEQLISKRVELRHLLGANLIPEPENKAAETLLGFRQFPSFYGNVEHIDWSRHQSAEIWKAAREALLRDAGALLGGT
jgi:exonuclease VII small subunit